MSLSKPLTRSDRQPAPAAGQRGFTLSEALISLTVLTSGLLALAQFQGDLHEAGRAAKTQAYAARLAEQKIEQLRYQSRLDYAGVASGTDEAPAQPGMMTSYRRRWTVSTHRDPSYKEVEVLAVWTSADGETRRVSSSAILAPTSAFSGDSRGGQWLPPDAFDPASRAHSRDD